MDLFEQTDPFSKRPLLPIPKPLTPWQEKKNSPTSSFGRHLRDKQPSKARRYRYHKDVYWQGGSGTEPEPETGTIGTVFPETESGTGTARTVFQEPKPEPEPFFPVRLYSILKHRKPSLQRNRQNRKPEPLEPFPPKP